MAEASSRWGVFWAIAAIVGGIGGLVGLELSDEPNMTLGPDPAPSSSSRA
jgi:hypothetical protein